MNAGIQQLRCLDLATLMFSNAEQLLVKVPD